VRLIGFSSSFFLSPVSLLCLHFLFLMHGWSGFVYLFILYFFALLWGWDGVEWYRVNEGTVL